MIIEKMLQGELSVIDIWKAYQDGINYNEQLNLADTVEENNLMYVGRQWEGVETQGLPTVTLDFIKPVVQFKVASITSSKTKLTVQPTGVAGKNDKEQKLLADVVNGQLDELTEREKLETKLLSLMTATAVDGDGCWHIYWDPDKKSGQPVDGDIAIEQISNVHVYFGNTASNEVQTQPYIIIERREYISNLKARAQEMDLEESEIDAIQPDRDNQYTITSDDNRVTVLTFYFRDYTSGTIQMVECTQNVLLCPQVDTGLSFYPVCWQNWEPRLNDYHGEPCVSELATNQITVNKLASMNAISLSRTAFPTILYNANLLPDGWDNSVGACIGVADLPNMRAADVATVIQGAATNSQVEGFFHDLLKLTKDLNGASDAILGNIDPNNTSAILALQKTSMVPLELNKRRMYAFLEDFARIAIDFMANYYGERHILLDNPMSGKREITLFDFDELADIAFNIKIDVGPTSQWSELAEMKMLDGLLSKQIIDGESYLKYMPNGLFANRQPLLEKIEQERKQEEMEDKQGALQSMLRKSPQLAQKVQALKNANPQGYEQVIRSLNEKMQG